jgi:hypothetical protein
MFIDCTGTSIFVDPETYPTGLVIRTLSAPADEGDVESDHGHIEPKLREAWPLHAQSFERRQFSLTEQREIVALEETGYEDFQIMSLFIDEANLIASRYFGVNVIERDGELGWIIELSFIGRDEQPVNLTLRMPQFSPTAIIDLGPPSPPEKVEEKPPGKPLWERLDEES